MDELLKAIVEEGDVFQRGEDSLNGLEDFCPIILGFRAYSLKFRHIS